MKKFYVAIMIALCALTGCKKFDDSSLWSAIRENASKIAKLEEQVTALNSSVTNIKLIIDAVQTGDMVSSVSPLADGSGYTLVFTSGKSIVIKHGKDGQDGQDGEDGKDGEDGNAPHIGVKKDADGIYYWTIDGNWLTDDAGNRIQADGVTPRFKIEDGYWFISYDGEKTWTKLGKATGEDGNGNGLILNINYTDTEIHITLADGTELIVPIAQCIPDGFVDLGLSVYWMQQPFYVGTVTAAKMPELMETIPEGYRLPTAAEMQELVDACYFSPIYKDFKRSVMAAAKNSFIIFPMGSVYSSEKKTDNTYYCIFSSVNSTNDYLNVFVSSAGNTGSGLCLVKDK